MTFLLLQLGDSMKTPTVNVENMNLWLAALESGQYVQGKSKLHNMDDDSWCCLGVACKAAIDNGVPLDVKVEESAGEQWEAFNNSGAYLPLAVEEWLGFTSRTGNPSIAGRSATWWNDGADLNFEGIAYLLRREYLTNV